MQDRNAGAIEAKSEGMSIEHASNRPLVSKSPQLKSRRSLTDYAIGGASQRDPHFFYDGLKGMTNYFGCNWIKVHAPSILCRTRLEYASNSNIIEGSTTVVASRSSIIAGPNVLILEKSFLR